LAREQCEHFFVLVSEIAIVALLLGEIEVAVGDAAQQDRDAEKAAHRRMPGREAHCAGILAEVAQPQGLRLTYEDAEDPAPHGQRSDLGTRLVVDAVREEPLELLPARVDHAERRIARSGQLGCGLDEAVENRLERELGCDSLAGVEQCAKASLIGG
jgi:hypothetical protein